MDEDTATTRQKLGQGALTLGIVAFCAATIVLVLMAVDDGEAFDVDQAAFVAAGFALTGAAFGLSRGWDTERMGRLANVGLATGTGLSLVTLVAVRTGDDQSGEAGAPLVLYLVGGLVLGVGLLLYRKPAKDPGTTSAVQRLEEVTAQIRKDHRRHRRVLGLRRSLVFGVVGLLLGLLGRRR